MMQVTSGLEPPDRMFLYTTKIHHVLEGVKSSQVGRLGAKNDKKEKLFSAASNTPLASTIENLNLIFLSSILFLLYGNLGKL
jgi:hypothetical protein